MIDPSFQWRFTRKVTGFVCGVLLVSSLLFWLIYQLSRHQVSQPDPFVDQGAVALYNLPELSSLIGGNWPMVVLGLGLIVCVSVFFGVVASFRVAGPAHRIRMILADMESGRFGKTVIQLRTADELQPLYLGVWRARARVAEALDALNRACTQDGSDAERLSAVRQVLAEFDTDEEVDGEPKNAG